MSLSRLTVSCGRGPEEARWFVSKLADALTLELADAGSTVVSRVAHGPDQAPFSVDLYVHKGAPLPASLAGTHELILPSPARGKRARKRWFVSVCIDDDAGASRETLRASDVTFQTCRASGAGGQHVNRTESAVRALHVPSGTTVRIESERSQRQNKQRALAVLARVLERREDARCAEQGRARRASAIQVERGRAVSRWRIVSGGLVRA